MPEKVNEYRSYAIGSAYASHKNAANACGDLNFISSYFRFRFYESAYNFRLDIPRELVFETVVKRRISNFTVHSFQYSSNLIIQRVIYLLKMTRLSRNIEYPRIERGPYTRHTRVLSIPRQGMKLTIRGQRRASSEGI